MSRAPRTRWARLALTIHVSPMLPELSRQQMNHDKSSRIDLDPPRTVMGVFSSTDNANWWMIGLSDLTILLLGFLVAWYVIDKKDLALQQPLVGISGTQEQQIYVVPDQRSLVTDKWQLFWV